MAAISPRASEARAPSGKAMSASRPVAHLYQRARAILAAQIAAGQLGQGTRLTESAVAAQFGISRAPARRALEELARDGLLVRAQGRGYEIAGRPGEQAPPQADAAAVATTQLLSPPRWEAIYTEVEEEIIGRISFARWRVNEAKLARHYAVSRTVAREVVARLQQRGLVLKDERSRWFAPALTPEHVGELYELRAVLEPVALAKAVPHLPPALLPAMRSALESALA